MEAPKAVKGSLQAARIKDSTFNAPKAVKGSLQDQEEEFQSASARFPWTS